MNNDRNAAAASRARRRWRSCSSSTAAARSGSPGRTTRSTSATCSSTTSSIPPRSAPRERFEAFARSVRDVLSQRWVRTEQTYERENPKRVYYLSMEFLIGRSLANNVTNLLLDPVVAARPSRSKASTGSTCSSRSPTPGWATAGSAGWRRASSTRWRRMQLPAMGYGLRYEYGIFRQSIRDGWQHEQPDNWLRRPDPWEVARPDETVEVKLELLVRDARRRRCDAIPGRPSTPDRHSLRRPVVGYGGKTINTLRLWAAAAPDYFDFQEFSSGDFVGALAETLAAESLTRVLYPGRLHDAGPGRCASCRSTSSSPARWPTSCGASAAATPTGPRCPRRSPSSSTTRTRRWPCPS